VIGGTRFDERAVVEDAGSPAASIPRQLVVVTGRLEIRSAHDGWLDAVIVHKGTEERISLAFPPGFTRGLRENALREVTACGRLRVVDGQKTLYLERLRRS
jgi:hypothetical protein